MSYDHCKRDPESKETTIVPPPPFDKPKTTTAKTTAVDDKNSTSAFSSSPPVSTTGLYSVKGLEQTEPPPPDPLVSYSTSDETEITEEPKTGDTEAPSSDETDKPTSDETQPPSSDDTEAPSSDETDKPTSDETQPPSSDDTEAPSSDDTDETDKPSPDETKAPPPKDTEVPVSDKTSPGPISTTLSMSTSEDPDDDEREPCEISPRFFGPPGGFLGSILLMKKMMQRPGAKGCKTDAPKVTQTMPIEIETFEPVTVKFVDSSTPSAERTTEKAPREISTSEEAPILVVETIATANLQFSDSTSTPSQPPKDPKSQKTTSFAPPIIEIENVEEATLLPAETKTPENKRGPLSSTLESVVTFLTESVPPSAYPSVTNNIEEKANKKTSEAPSLIELETGKEEVVTFEPASSMPPGSMPLPDICPSSVPPAPGLDYKTLVIKSIVGDMFHVPGHVRYLVDESERKSLEDEQFFLMGGCHSDGGIMLYRGSDQTVSGFGNSQKAVMVLFQDLGKADAGAVASRRSKRSVSEMMGQTRDLGYVKAQSTVSEAGTLMKSTLDKLTKLCRHGLRNVAKSVSDYHNTLMDAIRTLRRSYDNGRKMLLKSYHSTSDKVVNYYRSVLSMYKNAYSYYSGISRTEKVRKKDKSHLM
ncbi:S-antigen protein [Elysia marginata]|uniref:S-antigen protein n=1 Tax=Elysia marginata TaxID=1093978 RepID=A0AAV4IXU5_9GAST|nr:S-antigen protein [Elysia marginata]